jgi:hypothetical protein
MPAGCRFCEQGPLQSCVDLRTSPLWQDFATTAKFDRIDPPIAPSGQDCFLAVMGYRGLGRGKQMLNDCHIRVNDVECELVRSPRKRSDFPSWELHEKIRQQMSEIQNWGGKYATPIPAARVYDGCEA